MILDLSGDSLVKTDDEGVNLGFQARDTRGCVQVVLG